MGDAAEPTDRSAELYAEIGYPTAIVSDLTPDHMRAIGLLHGWDAPDPATARFLEIACFDGLNAIALAAAFPGMRCVGFDLAGSAIESGRRLATAAGIDNVELLQDNILTFPRTGEPFDYIACHGLYSWVPEPVREAVLDLIAARLAPGGVAYMTYDALPACASKYAIATYIQRQVADIAGLTERYEAMGRLVRLMARSQHPVSRLKPQVEHLADSLPNYDPRYVFHDWLAPYYRPSYASDMAGRSGHVGLRLVADATLADTVTYDLDDEARGFLDACGDFVERADAMGYLRGTRMFRADLMIRADSPPAPRADAFLQLRFSDPALRVPSEEGDGGAARFDAGRGFLVTDDDGMVAVLEALAEAAPAEVAVPDLVTRTGLALDKVEAALRGLLERGAVKVHSSDQPFSASPGERPTASRLARSMLGSGEYTATLRHKRFVATDVPARLLITLCDGTRTRRDIAVEMTGSLGMTITEEQVAAALPELAKLGLFQS